MKVNRMIRFICVMLMVNLSGISCDSVKLEIMNKSKRIEKMNKNELNNGFKDINNSKNNKLLDNKINDNRFVISIDSPLRLVENDDDSEKKVDGVIRSTILPIKSIEFENKVKELNKKLEKEESKNNLKNNSLRARETPDVAKVGLPVLQKKPELGEKVVDTDKKEDKDLEEDLGEEGDQEIEEIPDDIKELLKKNVDDLSQEDINKIENVKPFDLKLLGDIDFTDFNIEEFIKQIFPEAKELSVEEKKIKKELQIALNEKKRNELKKKLLKINQYYFFKQDNPQDKRKFYNLIKNTKPINESKFITPGTLLIVLLAGTLLFYIPKVGDHIIGTITAKNSDFYTVQINKIYNGYLMCVDGFRGATKKNRPVLNLGDVVFCEILVIYNYNLIELTCINIDELKSFNTNETYYGPLTNGFLISLNTKHIEILYKYDCYTLKLLNNLKYQLAIGFNGRLWVNSDSNNVLKIARFIKLSYNLTQPQIKQLYDHIFSTDTVKQ